MKKLLFALLLVLTACEERLSPEEQALSEARQAAKACYDDLLASRYEQFIAARVGMDSLPNGYREQLVTACKQFMAQQRAAHGGIASFQVSNARIDSTQRLIQVFLVLNYHDATSEEIVVPMVEQQGTWKMK